MSNETKTTLNPVPDAPAAETPAQEPKIPFWKTKTAKVAAISVAAGAAVTAAFCAFKNREEDSEPALVADAEWYEIQPVSDSVETN